MKTWLLLSIGLVSLMAQDYRTFEKEVLEKAPQIEALRLETDVAKLQGQKRLLYGNPSLEIEGSRFDADEGGSDNGWRAAIAQPLRVLGLGSDLQAYADALENIAKTGLKQGIAGLKVSLRTRYSDYVLAVRQKALIQEAIALARRLETIAKTRYEEGGGTKARLMQATLERMEAESKLLEQERRIQARYYALLAAAQTVEKPEIEVAFLYPISRSTVNATPSNPALERIEAEAKRFDAEAKIEDRSIKTWQIFTEYDKEPDQSIARLGVGVDLPLFNRNTQSRQIASIRARQKKLEAVRLRRTQRQQIASLQRQLTTLTKRYEALRNQLKKQETLLALFTEGYRTDQISLLDLIQTQKGLIATKTRMLQTEYLANLYHIQIDYLQGRLK
ncbi:TolC family protein [Hydrogenimonas urashimensis]|uniref:TolC family protein n=1 Tax=Hydrogenimonas urashimensis TaxID=2740515 RepID=UPI001914DFC2|nr:TolC family protein [Hydrogenimonas urashimensis]